MDLVVKQKKKYKLWENIKLCIFEFLEKKDPFPNRKGWKNVQVKAWELSIVKIWTVKSENNVTEVT